MQKKKFTLVELLISIALCSTLLLFATAFIEGLRGIERVKDFEYAISLARQAIESLKAHPWDKLEEVVKSDFDKDNPGVDLFKKVNWSGGTIGDGLRYERTITVEKIPPIKAHNDFPTYLKMVTVDIKWVNKQKKELNWSVSTLLTRLD